LWDKLADFGAKRSSMLISAPWPVANPAWLDEAASAEIGLVIAVVTEGRSVRAELNVPPSARPALYVAEATPAHRAIYEANEAVIASTLRISELRFAAAPAGAIPFVVEGDSLALPVAEFVDLEAEKARLAKSIAELEGDAQRTRKKLDNLDFVARAPAEVVEENRERLAEAEAAKAKLEAALRRIGTLG
jgi:valyl-tRNA synthetase